MAQKATTLLAFWVAVVTAVLAAAAFAVGITTPPRSGPYCVTSCVAYPYTDVASFVPRDYLWMYPAAVVALTFTVLMVCIHQYVPENTKALSRIGLCFASISAALITADYFIQLAVLQPSLLKGETAGLGLISQYNPHGIFIALEDCGYLFMSLAFLVAGLALVGRARLERAIRVVFIVSSLAAIGALVGLAVVYGRDLEYRFEVVVLSIDWTVLIVAGGLLSVLFKRARSPAGVAGPPSLAKSTGGS